MPQRERQRQRDRDRQTVGQTDTDRQTDRQTDKQNLDFIVQSTAQGHFRTRNRQTQIYRQQERERENSNSETLFYKDCSLGSVKNLSNNERERERESVLLCVSTSRRAIHIQTAI